MDASFPILKLVKLLFGIKQGKNSSCSEDGKWDETQPIQLTIFHSLALENIMQGCLNAG